MKFKLQAPLVLFAPLLAVTVLSVMTEKFNAYSNKYFIFLAIAFNLFSYAFYLGKQLVSDKFSDIVRLGLTPNNKVRIYVGLMSLAIILQAYNHYFVAGSTWFTPAGIMQYRWYLTVELKSALPFNSVKYLNFFFFSAGAFILANRSHLSTSLKTLIVTLLLAFIYLSTSRSSAFFILLISAFFYLLQQKWLNIRHIVVVGIIMITLLISFCVIGAIVGKTASIYNLMSYAIAPSHALDQIINHNNMPDPHILYTFKPIAELLTKLGFIGPQPTLFPYFYTPQATNVYTIFGPYLLDYGLRVTLVIFCIYGLALGMLQTLQENYPNNGYYTLLIATAFSALTLSVFHDYFLSSGFIWLIVLLGPLFFSTQVTKEIKSSKS